MDIFRVSMLGLQVSAAQFQAHAGRVVRNFAPSPSAQTDAAPGAESSAATNLSCGDVSADIVGEMMSLAGYRANIAAVKAEQRMLDTTLDLIA